jgi:hypothetical protein
MSYLQGLPQICDLAAQSRMLGGLSGRECRSDVPYVERGQKPRCKALLDHEIADNGSERLADDTVLIRLI